MIQNFHIEFLSSDFSVNICSMSGKSLKYVVYCGPEGRMYPNFNVLVMLCRNLEKENPDVFDVLYHTNLSRT